MRICLAMIVKNESEIIERCLKSVIDYIDSYCICDTGSDDDTVEKIEKFMVKNNKKGIIFNEKFKDFNYNRTKLLRMAKDKCDFLLLMDADFELNVVDKDWKNKLDLVNNYRVELVDNLMSKVPFLVQSDKDYKYRGLSYEVLEGDGWEIEYKNLEGVEVHHHHDGKFKSEKYKYDCKSLEQDACTDKTNYRNYFFLAETYFTLGRFETAREWYRRRVEKGGNKEEVYLSKYKIGVCTEMSEGFAKAKPYYLEAYEYRPTRLEALYQIIRYYRSENPQIGFAYAMIAYPNCLQYPEDDLLMVNKTLHKTDFLDMLSVCAFFSGHHLLVCELSLRLLSLTKNENERLIDNFNASVDRLKKNIVWTTKLPKFEHEESVNEFKKIQILSSIDLSKKIMLKMKDGKDLEFVTGSPCVCRVNDGYVCNLPYRHKGDKMSWVVNERINFDGDFLITDRKFVDVPENLDRVVYGIDNIRLRAQGDSIISIGNTRDSPSEVVLGDYDNLDVRTHIPSPLSEKHWVFAHDEYVVYGFYPFSIGKIVCNRYIEVLNYKEEGLKGCRGGSAGVIVEDEVWFVTRIVQMEKNKEKRRIYHKFVAINPLDLKITRYSQLFKFSEEEDEMCLGFTLDEGKNLWFSYSSNKKSLVSKASLGFIKWTTAKECKEVYVNEPTVGESTKKQSSVIANSVPRSEYEL